MKMNINNKLNSIKISLNDGTIFNVPYTFFRGLNHNNKSCTMQCLVENKGNKKEPYIIGKANWVIHDKDINNIVISIGAVSESLKIRFLKHHMLTLYNTIGDCECTKCKSVMDLSEFAWTLRIRKTNIIGFYKCSSRCYKCNNEIASKNKNKVANKNVQKMITFDDIMDKFEKSLDKFPKDKIYRLQNLLKDKYKPKVEIIEEDPIEKPKPSKIKRKKIRNDKESKRIKIKRHLKDKLFEPQINIENEEKKHSQKYSIFTPIKDNTKYIIDTTKDKIFMHIDNPAKKPDDIKNDTDINKKVSCIFDSITGPLHGDKNDDIDLTKIKLMSQGINSVADLADERIRIYIKKVIDSNIPSDEKTDVLLLYFLLMSKLSN